VSVRTRTGRGCSADFAELEEIAEVFARRRVAQADRANSA
jgi:hypothetical protein